MHKFLFIFTLAIVTFTVEAQEEGDFLFGDISDEEYDMKIYSPDTSANAVVLKEFGKTWVEYSISSYTIHHYIHQRIKIFNTSGFSHATIIIPLKKGESSESISKIKGSTFNSKKEDKVNSDDIYKEDKGSYYLKKFTLPNIKEGSIVEISYYKRSPFIYNYQNWYFQAEIPKLNSEYWTYIPAIFDYNIALKGYLSLACHDNLELTNCLFTPQGTSSCNFTKYEMKDIPAFIEEDYMTAQSNFLSSLNYELKEIKYFTTRKTVKYNKEWKDVDKLLKESENFGAQIKKGRHFFWKEKLGKILEEEKDTLIRAKKVYEFVKNWYTWNNYYGIECQLGIKKAYDKRTGDVADINLSLISALRFADIEVEPVILSTRENGSPTEIFPVLSDYNYVIALCKINGQKYFLDATEKQLPFGMLPLRCMNGKGRVISSNFKSEWIDIPYKEKIKLVSFFDVKMNDSGKLKGTIKNSYFGYSGFLKRTEIKGFNNAKEYTQDLIDKQKNLKILKSEIKNLDHIDSLLTEILDVEFTDLEDLDENKLFLDPFVFDRIKENPFKSRERYFPIDFGIPMETQKIIQVEVPKEFKISNLPEKQAVTLPDNGGRFLFNATQLGNSITVNHFLTLSKPSYPSNQYHYLKELFGKAIQSQNQNIVIEKVRK